MSQNEYFRISIYFQDALDQSSLRKSTVWARFVFFIYSLIVKKLPVVKIYFEDETRSYGRFRQDVVYDSSLKASKVIFKPLSPIHEVSIGENSQDAADVSRKEKQDFTGEILSFLEGLGIPMNTGDVSPVNIPTTPLPRVNPNGASLPILMRKIDNYLKLSADKTCPTSHLRKGKSDSVLLVSSSCCALIH